MVGKVIPYRGPIDPHSGRPVAQVQAEQQAAQKALLARQAAEGNVVRARDLGISGETRYSDPTTGVAYNYATAGGGAGGAGGTRSGTRAGTLPTGAAGTPGAPLSINDVRQFLPAPVPQAPMPDRIPHPSSVDRSAAEAAAYGRAKDKIGANAGGAMKALARRMSARGISGSGLESAGISDVIGTAQGELGDVSRDQAIEGVKRDYAETDRNYAGDLSQRSGDMGFLSNQRSQDISQEQGRVSQIPALLSLIMRNRTGAAY